jgi:hypothetical protein
MIGVTWAASVETAADWEAGGGGGSEIARIETTPSAKFSLATTRRRSTEVGAEAGGEGFRVEVQKMVGLCPNFQFNG